MKRSHRVIHVVGYIVTTVVAVSLFVTVLHASMGIPDVKVSNSTGQCVEVINYDNSDYSCDNMPTKYSKIWVK